MAAFAGHSSLRAWRSRPDRDELRDHLQDAALAAASPSAAPAGPEAALRAAVARALAGDAHWAAPGAVSWVESTGSTNADLVAVGQRARAEPAPIAARMLRMAHRQTGGRGRLARGWSTPPEAGFAVSLGFALPLAPAALSGFALVCGLAVHTVLQALGAPVRLKWPNDVLGPDGRAKLGGILVEIVQLDAVRTWVVVGIGLNLRAGAALSAQWGRAIADLESLGLGAIDRFALAAALAAALEARIDAFVGAGFAPFVADFDIAHAFHRRRVTIDGDGAQAWSGVCEGVDARGEVLVRRADGRLVQVLSGDVSMAALEN